jgi:hypothetical protein
MQSLALRSTLESGDLFVARRKRLDKATLTDSSCN